MLKIMLPCQSFEDRLAVPNCRPTIVIGAGGHAKVVVATLRESGTQVHAILDDSCVKWGSRILGVPVLGATEMIQEYTHPQVIIAVGDNETRRRIVAKFKSCVNWLTAVHPRSCVHPSVRIGKGTVVFAGAIIQPDSVIGDHVIVNTGCTVDHDCIIGNYSHLAPGTHITGNVLVQEGAFLGASASVIPGVIVGKWAKVGAGSVVLHDVPDFEVVVGVPARRMGKE